MLSLLLAFSPTAAFRGLYFCHPPLRDYMLNGQFAFSIPFNRIELSVSAGITEATKKINISIVFWAGAS